MNIRRSSLGKWATTTATAFMISHSVAATTGKVAVKDHAATTQVGQKVTNAVDRFIKTKVTTAADYSDIAQNTSRKGTQNVRVQKTSKKTTQATHTQKTKLLTAPAFNNANLLAETEKSWIYELNDRKNLSNYCDTTKIFKVTVSVPKSKTGKTLFRIDLKPGEITKDNKGFFIVEQKVIFGGGKQTQEVNIVNKNEVCRDNSITDIRVTADMKSRYESPESLPKFSTSPNDEYGDLLNVNDFYLK